MSILETSLVTVFATVLGVVAGTVYLIMSNEAIRTNVIMVAVSTIFRLIDHNKATAFIGSVVESANSVAKIFNPPNMSSVKQASLDGNLLSIPFVFRGSSYTYITIYNGRAARLNSKRFSRKGPIEVDLHHHPGIPFTVTAEDLEVDEILVKGENLNL